MPKTPEMGIVNTEHRDEDIDPADFSGQITTNPKV